MTQGGEQDVRLEQVAGCSGHSERATGTASAERRGPSTAAPSSQRARACLTSIPENSESKQDAPEQNDNNNNSNDDDNGDGNSGNKESGEDVKSLLNFVNVVTTDIKAALDKSAPCKRSVDHRKFLQKQLKRFSGSPQAFSGYHQYHHHQQQQTPSSPDCYRPHHTTANFTVNGSCPDAAGLPSGETLWHEIAHYNPSAVAPSLTPSPFVVSLRNMSNPTATHMCAHGNDDDTGLSDSRTVAQNENAFHDSKAEDSSGEDGEATVSKTSAVPLRQRQLPASFWKEPNIPKSIHDPTQGNCGLRHDASALHGLGVYPAFSPDHVLKNIGYHKDSFSTGHVFSDSHQNISSQHFDYSRKLPSTDTDSRASLLTAWHYSLLQDSKRKHSNNAGILINSAPSHTQLPFLSNSLSYHSGPSTMNARLGLYRTWDPSSISSGQHPYGSEISINQRPLIWRPIPTKTVTSFPSRFHPFADVH